MGKEKAPIYISDAYREALRKAQEETEAILAADSSRSLADPTLPIFQFVAQTSLLEEKARFEAGDKNALLGAIRICANHDLVMPDWVARAFIRAYDKVLRHQVATWDDAFGRPLPKGKHLSAARKKREKSPAVWLEVRHMVEAGWPIDEGLFEQVGNKLGLGKTQAAEFYYDFDARVRSPSIAAQVLLEPLRAEVVEAVPEVPEKRKTLRKYQKQQ